MAENMRSNRYAKRYLKKSSRMILSIIAVSLSHLQECNAVVVITGGKGNQVITDPGWPEGVAAIFNHHARIAWWEGPPFGGGQYHSECLGGTESFNAVLAKFS